MTDLKVKKCFAENNNTRKQLVWCMKRDNSFVRKDRHHCLWKQSDCYTRLKCDKDKVMKENVNQNSFKELMGATLQFHKIRFFWTEKKFLYISVLFFYKIKKNCHFTAFQRQNFSMSCNSTIYVRIQCCASDRTTLAPLFFSIWTQYRGLIQEFGLEWNCLQISAGEPPVNIHAPTPVSLS